MPPRKFNMIDLLYMVTVLGDEIYGHLDDIADTVGSWFEDSEIFFHVNDIGMHLDQMVKDEPIDDDDGVELTGRRQIAYRIGKIDHLLTLIAIWPNINGNAIRRIVEEIRGKIEGIHAAAVTREVPKMFVISPSDLQGDWRKEEERLAALAKKA